MHDSALNDPPLSEPAETADPFATPAAGFESAIAEYCPVAAALAELRRKHQNVVYDVATKTGMKAAREAKRELQKLRTGLEDKRKELKAPALERAKLIDTEAARIKSEIEALETPLAEQIDAEVERQRQEEARVAEIERQRVAALKERVDAIRTMPMRCMGWPSVDIEAAIRQLVAEEPGDDFAEAKPDAIVARAESLERLRQLLERTKTEEAERAQRERERQELEERRRQDEARQAQERREREERETRDRLAREEREREEQRKRDADAAELQRQRDEFAAMQRQAQEAQERMQNAMSEIQGIQQQVIIAQMGRAGVRKGGTLACIRETLAETEALVIDDRFGVMKSSAQAAKDGAVASIKQLLATAEEREAIAQAERERRDAERAEQAELDAVQTDVDSCMGASADFIAKMLTHVSIYYGDPAKSDRVREAAERAGKTMQALHNAAVAREAAEAEALRAEERRIEAERQAQAEREAQERREAEERERQRTEAERVEARITAAARVLYDAGKHLSQALTDLCDPEGNIAGLQPGPERDELMLRWEGMVKAIHFADHGPSNVPL